MVDWLCWLPLLKSVVQAERSYFRSALPSLSSQGFCPLGRNLARSQKASGLPTFLSGFRRDLDRNMWCVVCWPSGNIELSKISSWAAQKSRSSAILTDYVLTMVTAEKLSWFWTRRKRLQIAQLVPLAFHCCSLSTRCVRYQRLFAMLLARCLQGEGRRR